MRVVRRVSVLLIFISLKLSFHRVRLFFKCCLILPNSAIVNDEKSYVDSMGKASQNKWVNENISLWKRAVPHHCSVWFGFGFETLVLLRPSI